MAEPRRAGPMAFTYTLLGERADGLEGLPESIEASRPLTIVQTCVLYLIRNTFRLASRKNWDKTGRIFAPVW